MNDIIFSQDITVVDFIIRAVCIVPIMLYAFYYAIKQIIHALCRLIGTIINKVAE